MKCEICNKAEAETAITREKDGEEQELYVCRACAVKERESASDEASDHIGMQGCMNSLAEALAGFAEIIQKDIESFKSEHKKLKTPRKTLPIGRIAKEYRYKKGLHLEGLYLIGELDAVERGMRAMKMQLKPIACDEVREAGHSFELVYSDDEERAKRVLKDLMREERNARIRLVEEMPLVLGDSVCRSLAIIKNCRLLSPIELFDLLSPIKLAAFEGLLDGMTVEMIDNIVSGLNINASDRTLHPNERDQLEASMADSVHLGLSGVKLNERGEELFSWTSN